MMGEQKDPLISVHDVVGFLPDFDSLCDPPCCRVRFPDDNCCLLPVDDVIFDLLLSAATAAATPSGEFSVRKKATVVAET